MDPRTASPGPAELGRRVGASERMLSRLFRDEVGMGYTVWRNELPLQLVTLMLAEGRTVSQTASACGYSSASAFVTTSLHIRANPGIAVPVGAVASAMS
jgi:AraC-like DNA-binding protein